jgi:tetratricopeptide (TPR) repeat protein
LGDNIPDPNFPPCFHNYGLLLAKQKKYIAAIAQFDKAILLFQFFPAHCDRGSALKEIGRFEDALASLQKQQVLPEHSDGLV